MYRIFYLEKAFCLADQPLKNIKNIKIKDVNDLCFTLRNWLEEEAGEDICLTGLPADEMLRMVKEIYQFMKAAGGVVKNNEGKYLFIKRFGIWDLPKGKIEKGETPESAALREVEEETGINRLKIIRPLNDSWHIYPWKDNYTLKQTYWFLMESDFNGTLIPQTQEDITEAVWLTPEEAKEAIGSSYRSLRENLQEVFQ